MWEFCAGTGTNLPQEPLARVPGAVEGVSLTLKGLWRAANPFTHLRGSRESGGIDSEGKRKSLSLNPLDSRNTTSLSWISPLTTMAKSRMVRGTP